MATLCMHKSALVCRAVTHRYLVNICNLNSYTCLTLPAFKKETLSEENRARCVASLRSSRLGRLGAQDAAQGRKKAAVLVPLCIVGGEPALLYTLRSSRLRRNGGQVSFPGGLQDEGDAGLRDTVLRETREELGISGDVVDVWGHGPFLPAADASVCVRPYLGYVGEIDIARLAVNDAEVAQVFSTPLRTLCDPENFAFTQFRSGYVIPVYRCAGHRIWGLTALITHLVLASLLPNIYRNKLKLIPHLKT
ncbi:mitochondrial coenzyme A diphosphatase NUDT8 [Bacillus rossius redtenbacheri]|uniref:mitochondrial coenzyme A diphosphatase NUDT8 n=1 Tax=Bacillus rossius redtenbacheri TaxID=93214 RepID=UPI002FDEBAEE